MNKLLFAYLIKPVLYGISLLPFWFLYRISDFLYVWIFYIIGYRKNVVYQNLQNAFPEKSPQEIRKIAQKFYAFFCDMILETLKMMSISKNALTRRVKFLNLEIADKFYHQKRSFFIVLGHSGSWEWASPSFEIQTNYHVLVIYKPLSHKLIDDFVLKLRTRFGQEATSMKNTVRNIVRLRNQLTVTALIGDQRPENPKDAYWTTFFGQEAGFLWGTEKLSKKLDVPVIFAQIKRPKRGYYEIFFEILTESPQQTEEGEITENFVRKLEQQISQEPEIWLWSHKRWKQKRPIDTKKES